MQHIREKVAIEVVHAYDRLYRAGLRVHSTGKSSNVIECIVIECDYQMELIS